MVRLPALLCLVLAPLFVLAGPQPGKYSPVTDDEVPRLKFNHYFLQTNKPGGRDDFTWSFSKGGFTVKKGRAAIPTDLLKKLLPEGTTADEITGKWELGLGKTGGQEIVFTAIKADGKPGRDKATYHIYKTAPTVIRIGEPQYVFAIEQK